MNWHEKSFGEEPIMLVRNLWNFNFRSKKIWRILLFKTFWPKSVQKLKFAKFSQFRLSSHTSGRIYIDFYKSILVNARFGLLPGLHRDYYKSDY